MNGSEVWELVHQFAIERLADQEPVYTNVNHIRNFITDVSPTSIGRRSDDGTTNSSRVTRGEVERLWAELNGGPSAGVLYFTRALLAAAMPDTMEGFQLRVGAALGVEETALADRKNRSGRRGQGFLVDPLLRTALEVYGMRCAEEHFRSLGYDVDPTVHTSNPFDLRCQRNDEILHVEVKATTSFGNDILVTRGEVDFARENQGTMALFLVHSVTAKRTANEVVVDGGEVIVLQPWDVDAGELIPITYTWRRSV